MSEDTTTAMTRGGTTARLLVGKLMKVIYIGDNMNNNWNNYIEYLKVWAEQHKEIENEGMSPVCYDEFLDNESEEL